MEPTGRFTEHPAIDRVIDGVPSQINGDEVCSLPLVQQCSGGRFTAVIRSTKYSQYSQYM